MDGRLQQRRRNRGRGYVHDRRLRAPRSREMVKGRPAIEALWKQQMAGATVERITTLDVKPLGGNAAREIGTATLKTKAQPPEDVVIKYAVVWQKEDGHWKLLQDIWNENK